MTRLLDADVERVLTLGNGESDPVIEAMTTYGREHSFPIVGPAVGRFLRVAATMVDAERIFEFGSGFGYSAVWFAGALPETGEIVLTDYDGDNLDRAREFMRDAGYDELATYRAGDAVQSFEATDGDFDVVLIDHEKERYTDAFERAADELADGGVVIADNVMDGPVEPADVAAVLDGADPTDATTAGIVDYVETVRDDPRFETSLVPLGQGIAVSVER